MSTLRAFNQASIFFLSLFLPFLLLVVVVDALPLRGFCSLSLFLSFSSVPAHQHGARNTASFFLTLFSVYRVSHEKCCVRAILLEIVADMCFFVFKLDSIIINDDKIVLKILHSWDSIFFTEFFKLINNLNYIYMKI